jgi:hypothetical protein
VKAPLFTHPLIVAFLLSSSAAADPAPARSRGAPPPAALATVCDAIPLELLAKARAPGRHAEDPAALSRTWVAPYSPSTVLGPGAHTCENEPGVGGAIAAVDRALMAYSRKDLDGYAVELESEFRFESYAHAGDPEPEARFGRDEELAITEHIFHGFTRPGGMVLPAAEAIEIRCESWKCEGGTGRAVLTLEDVRITFHWADGRVEIAGPARHTVGVEQRAAGSEPPRWRIVEWREESLDSLTPPLAAVDRPATGADSRDNRAPAPGKAAALIDLAPQISFGIRAFETPLHPPGVVRFGLPRAGDARLRLVDVAGRSMMSRDLSGLAPGVHEVRLGEIELAPGVYWLALEQGTRSAVARVVWLR